MGIHKKPFLLGLTGSIATGKSTVLKMFQTQGIKTFSADKVVHDLYKGAAVHIIRKFYSASVLNNKVDRSKLAKFIQRNPDKLGQLEALIHPLVQEKYLEFISSANKSGEQLLLIDVPLLFESDYDYGLDAIAVTYCDPAIQIERAMARPNMTQEKLQLILSHQMSQEEKRQRADFQIDTNLPLAQTHAQTVEIIAKCLALRANFPDSDVRT